MKPQAIGQAVLAPPSVDFGVTVIGVSDNGVVKVADMAPDLMKSSGFWVNTQQRTPWLMGAADTVHHTLSLLEDALVVLHRGGDGDGFVVWEIPPYKGDIGFFPVGEGELKWCGPFLLFSEQQAPRGLKIQAVDRVDMVAYLVADPLQARLGITMVRITMHYQPGRLCHNDPIVGLIEYREWTLLKHSRCLTTLEATHVC